MHKFSSQIRTCKYFEGLISDGVLCNRVIDNGNLISETSFLLLLMMHITSDRGWMSLAEIIWKVFNI